MNVRNTGCVVVYHSTSRIVPPAANYRIHNVPPVILRKQLSWLKRNFNVVSIDSWFAASDTAGTAAITFDDGYESVFREALPILFELGLPATLFICGRMLEGGVFWRDKQRYLIRSGLVDDFLEFAAGSGLFTHLTGDFDFFAASCSSRINSARLNRWLDRFLQERGLSEELDIYRNIFRHADCLVDHPLIAYGNHGYEHYVMSSLEPWQQKEELMRMECLLDSLHVRRSRIFCLPFGKDKCANDATLDICAEMEFKGLLYCRMKQPRDLWRDGSGPVKTGERWLMPGDHIPLGLRNGRLAPLLRRIKRVVVANSYG